jgi:hypothetical protein
MGTPRDLGESATNASVPVSMTVPKAGVKAGPAATSFAASEAFG